MKIGTFQAQSIATVASVYVLIVVGGLVSSTGSGLACPDWPLCHGQIVPVFTSSVLIEYLHRLWTIVVTVSVISTVVFAWKKYRWPHKVTAFAVLTLILLFSQVMLGMVTVRSGTEPLVVTAHLALATMVFGSALTAAVTSFTYRPKEAS